MKKQTAVEELAKKYYPDESDLMEMMQRIAFKHGYTECKERMYSETIEFGKWLDENTQQREYYPMSAMTMEELFQQFKKK